MVKPTDLRPRRPWYHLLSNVHGEDETASRELYNEHHDLEPVRAPQAQAREMTQVHARIQPKELKESVSFYESRALEGLS